MVRLRVQRSVQSPLYSIFREENTRQTCAVAEAKAHAGTCGDDCGDPPRHFWSSLWRGGGGGGGGLARLQTDSSGVLYFPGHNDATAELAREEAEAGPAPACVALIGATGFFSKFLAEQYLNRGISVTVMTRDMEKAKAIFVPLAAGERQRRLEGGKGLVPLAPPECTPRLVDDGASDVAAPPTPPTPSKGDNAPAVARYRYEWQVLRPAGPPRARQVSLEIVAGDFTDPQHVEFATRHATAVYYLAALVSPDTSRHFMDGERTRYGSFLRAFDACRRADALFIALTPLWVHGSWLSPVYWYRRLCTHPPGYTQAVLHRECTLLMRQGAPAPRCYLGLEEGEDEPPMWLYWWRIWRSTELPADEERRGLSPVRFSLIRCADLVYPSLHERLFAAKNNRIDDQLHLTTLDQGSLDARLVANVVVKAVSLCRSVVESRIDLAGGLRGGVDMRDTAAVYDLFTSFRNES
ncbi:hypothetical protein STCU_00412 [Strigomonas culicis]|nr:hypothetical protein STCU_00412 [Strigomonas culicis]|eukprot:EPY36777.1 hypothetical protein STCU_00412 [Strigomonas culicis]